MRGSVYRRCYCRIPGTRQRYTKDNPCPQLKDAKHGKWYARYEAATEGRRQPELGPFDSKRVADGELAKALAEQSAGIPAADRTLRAVAYLGTYMAGKRNLKASTRETDEEAFRLYWVPGLGPKIRLTDVRDRHVSAVITAMLQINQPLPEGEKPSETLRRMIAARADDVRRELPAGEERHKKSTKPLSPARIERMFAPFRAAMNAAVKTGKIGRNPCDGVELPRAAKPRPMAWTPAREARFRAELATRTAAEDQVLEGRVLTTVERQRIWADPELRPVPVMVWLPSHTGVFLDYLDEISERLAPLFVLAAHCGLRRDEIIGLAWADVHLDEGFLEVLETGSGEGPKSEAGKRIVPIAAIVVPVLRAWRKVQAADRLAWGADWADTGLVFTREDGSAVPEEWVSRRFETLAYRAGVPPIRFHDVRHGAASLAKAAGLDSKYISAMLGHSRTSFTDAVYVTLFPEAQQAAADAAAAVVPRRPRRAIEGSA